MDFIYLKKTGFFTRFKKKYVPIDRSISYYLHHYPKIVKDFTVLDLMNLLKKNQADIEFLFEAYTRGFLLKPFIDELNLIEIPNKENKISVIEFSWSTDEYNEKEIGKAQYSLSDYVHISGIVTGEEVKYSLSFTPLSEIKDVTFKLNKKYKISYYKMGEIWEEDKKPENIIFFKGIKEFTLNDFIGAFLNEISFSGYPDSRNEESKKLEEISQRVELGKEQTYPWEEIQLKFKRKIFKKLQKKKETKTNLLKLAILKKEIEFLKKKSKENKSF